MCRFSATAEFLTLVFVSPTIIEALDRGANSCRPLDHLIGLNLTLTLTFDLILIGGRGIAMDYLCAKFSDFSFSCFGFIVRTDKQTDRQTDRQNRMIAILTQLPSA